MTYLSYTRKQTIYLKPVVEAAMKYSFMAFVK